MFCVGTALYKGDRIMQTGIIGLPASGKSTVFYALTGGQTRAKRVAPNEPNVAVVKVPDHRLWDLAEIFKPRRVVPADVEYLDFPPVARAFGKSEGIGGKFLADVSKCDALVHVVRAFVNESVPHLDGSVDPLRDATTMDMELMFSDLALLERRLERVRDSISKVKLQEREAVERERDILSRIKEQLEKEIPIRAQSLNEEERKTIRNYRFLTEKPLLVLMNIGEDQLPRAVEIEQSFRVRYAQTHTAIAAICGQLEMELAELDESERPQFLHDLGIPEPGLNRVIRICYELLGLISFFTVGEDEVKAWTIKRGTPAVEAAGVIHTDIQRGFIRAEVTPYHDFMRYKNFADARKHGVVRLEGKNYVVQDGDICHFLFNI